MKSKLICLVGIGALAVMTNGCNTLSSLRGDDAAKPTVVAAPIEGASVDTDKLKAIVDARADEKKARDQFRHPVETLAFFGLTPNMTVVEALPGGGWYSQIIIPYVNGVGEYGAVNYQAEMFKLVVPSVSDERLARFVNFPKAFPVKAAEEWGALGNVTAWAFGEAPDAYVADAVLYVRALHNLNRVGGTHMDDALAETYKVLKPGGIVGVVQHRAAESATGKAASGANGYLRQSDVIAKFEAAGFVFEEASEINANPADEAGADDIVWRLPPTLGLGDKNRDAFVAIGESDRMTLRFRKPE